MDFKGVQSKYQLLPEENECVDQIAQQGKITATEKEFRKDIALLRALAISSVLAYHFWPTVFSLGFLGVDVFFVISGYLIMRILQRSKENRINRMFLEFYYCRLKRILPTYYLILFLAGLSMIFVYTSVWSKRYFTFYFGAIFFYINLDLWWKEGDYFAQGTEEMPFLHTWSLGVEMQFYLLAPFLFYLSRIGAGYRLNHLILWFPLLISLHFYYNSTPLTAFYHPFARIWEFLCGMLASRYTADLKCCISNRQVNFATSIALTCTLVMFLPYFDETIALSYLQLMICVTSAAFMLFSANCSFDWSIFHLQYLARISYSLYLVHYPVLRFAQYLARFYGVCGDYVPLPALTLTFAISSLIHHHFENPLLCQKKKLKVFINIGKYFIFCLLIGLKWKIVIPMNGGQKSAVASNAKFTDSYYPLEGGTFIGDGYMNPPIPPFGHYVYQGNTGKLKIVIIGNSWAAQQAHLIRKLFPENQTASLDLFSMPSFVYGIHNFQPIIKKRTPFMLNFLKKTRPDIVLLLLRNGDLTPMKKSEDQILESYWEGIHNISKYTKTIFIEGHQPFDCTGTERDFLNRFVDNLEKNENMEKMNPPFNESFYDSPVNQRLKVLMQRCEKCHLIDIAEAFIDHERNLVLTYDRATMMAYLDNECHLTAAGLKKIERTFRIALQNVLKK